MKYRGDQMELSERTNLDKGRKSFSLILEFFEGTNTG